VVGDEEGAFSYGGGQVGVVGCGGGGGGVVREEELPLKVGRPGDRLEGAAAGEAVGGVSGGSGELNTAKGKGRLTRGAWRRGLSLARG